MTRKEKLKEFRKYINWILELDLDGDLNFLAYIREHNSYIIERLLELSNKSQIMDFVIELRNKYQRKK